MTFSGTGDTETLIGTLGIANGGTNTTSFTTDGVVYFDGAELNSTSVGTSGYVLTSNGTGNAPTFQVPAATGIVTLDAGTGSATGSTVTIAGGSNINTTATSATLTVNLDNSPSVSGSVTAGTGLTATTGAITATDGNVVITSGNLTLPATTATVGQITLGGDLFLHEYGTRSTFCGNGSGNLTHTGASNTALGYETLTAITSDQGQTAIGEEALKIAAGGTNNTAVGAAALVSLTSGSYNVAIGSAAAYGYTSSESSNIIIGYFIDGTVGESNVLRIGTGTGTGSGELNACYIAGITGETVTGSAVLCSTSGQLGTISSSIRVKENVQDIIKTEVMKLRPVSFNYIADKNKKTSYGLIAEEVEKIFPDLVLYDKNNEPSSIKYHELPVLLLNEVQELSKEIKELKKEIDRLKKVRWE